MKKLLVVLIQLCLFQVAIGQSWFGSGINGEGSVVERTLDIKDFDAISLTTSGKVYLTQGDKFEVRVVAQQNIIDNLTKRVSDREWRIGFEKNVRRYDKLELYITLPQLRNAHISGSGDIKSTNTLACSNDVSVSISGSGNITLDLEATAINGRISGSGDIALRGKADKLDLSISGSGDINATDLTGRQATIAIAGSGDCKVSASEDLDVRISGSGDVQYTGRPRINTRISGSGSLRSL